MKKLGLRVRLDRDIGLVDPEDDPRYRDYWTHYHALMARKGVSPDLARTIVRTSTTVIGALMVKRGAAQAMICGTFGHYEDHLKHVCDIVGLRNGVQAAAALSLLVMPKGLYFIADTYVTPDPSVEEIVEMTLLAAEEVRRFGIVPKIALLSHSNFGSSDTASARKKIGRAHV